MVGRFFRAISISLLLLVAGCGAYQPQFKPFQKPTDTPSYQTRNTSGEIKVIQRALKNHGYDPGQIDGIAGKRTRKAIKDFQRDIGLPVTGTMSLETRKQLGL